MSFFTYIEAEPSLDCQLEQLNEKIKGIETVVRGEVEEEFTEWNLKKLETLFETLKSLDERRTNLYAAIDRRNGVY